MVERQNERVLREQLSHRLVEAVKRKQIKCIQELELSLRVANVILTIKNGLIEQMGRDLEYQHPVRFESFHQVCLAYEEAIKWVLVWLKNMAIQAEVEQEYRREVIEEVNEVRILKSLVK